MQDAQATDDTTFRLIYRSRVRIPYEQRRAELGTLFSGARSNNKKQRITGALMLSDDWFVQTLEGEESAVRELFARIERDPRHDQVALLGASVVGERVFGRWSMAKVATDGEPDIPLIAHKEGIAAAASRGDTTPEQARVLAVMRDAAASPAPLVGA